MLPQRNANQQFQQQMLGFMPTPRNGMLPTPGQAPAGGMIPTPGQQQAPPWMGPWQQAPGVTPPVVQQQPDANLLQVTA
jgi:hypothetical protein